MIETIISILNMSITATYVALIVMVVRLLIKRAPKIFSYALWGVVLFRLICPFSFESSISLLLPNTNTIPQGIVYSQSPAIESGIGIVDTAVNHLLYTSYRPVPYVSINPIQFLLYIASLIWIFGMMFLLVYSVLSYIGLKIRVSEATLVSKNIFESDKITTPFVLGFIRPKIFIPVGISKDEIRYIVKHEQVHIKRFDYLIKPVAFLALTVHWFNPILWISYKLMCKDMEMSCDESVLRDSKEDIRGLYSKSLLSMSQKQSAFVSPLAFGENSVKTRIKNVLKFEKPVISVVIIALLSVSLIAVTLLTNPKASTHLTQNMLPINTTKGAKFGEQLIKYKSKYVGDASNIVNLIDKLQGPYNSRRGDVSLQTQNMPYEISIPYFISGVSKTDITKDKYAYDYLFKNAIIIFSLIDNVDRIVFGIGDSNGRIAHTFTREMAEEYVNKDVRTFSENKEGLGRLIELLDY